MAMFGSLLWVVVVVIVACFSGVLLFGAPFLPTLRPQIGAALDLLELKPGQTMLELGCGDGRVMIAAAERGIRVIGYELNPLLALISWLRTRRYGSQVRVVWGNYWQAEWPPADGIFAFILPRYMDKLKQKIVSTRRRPVKLASFAFKIPTNQFIAQRDGVYLYRFDSAPTLAR